MSQFTKSLVVTPLADGNTWVLREDFGFYVGQSAAGNQVTVPCGFVTDFATVPIFIRWYVNNWGLHGNAAVIHDWLYWNQSIYSREEADQIFRDGMVVLGVSPSRRFFIYWAVRIFGGWAWERNKWDRESGFQRVLKSMPIKHAETIQRPNILKRTWQQMAKTKSHQG